MEGIDGGNGTRISLHFRQFVGSDGKAGVEKAVGDAKHRYLCGIATGLKWDGNGERVTENGLADIVKQAESGDILLYSDIHGIKETQDIGILDNFRILPDGNWYVEFRLYDELDGIGPEKLATIDTLWKQVMGLPPYKKPRQKGFSIEGSLPKDKIILREEKKVIDGIHLEGVVVVPQPAYEDSIAAGVYKALGIQPPYVYQNEIKTMLAERAKAREADRTFSEARWDLEAARDELVEKTMKSEADDKSDRLRAIFSEYGECMASLILENAALFKDDDQTDGTDEPSAYSAEDSLVTYLANIRDYLTKLVAAKEKA